jgi:hypothetical protein
MDSRGQGLVVFAQTLHDHDLGLTHNYDAAGDQNYHKEGDNDPNKDGNCHDSLLKVRI